MMGYDTYYDYGRGSIYAGDWFLMLILFLLAAAAIGFIVYFVVKDYERNKQGTYNQATDLPTAPPETPAPTMSPSEEAIQIAKRRLAAGEITTDEYQEIMKHLRA